MKIGVVRTAPVLLIEGDVLVPLKGAAQNTQAFKIASKREMADSAEQGGGNIGLNSIQVKNDAEICILLPVNFEWGHSK